MLFKKINILLLFFCVILFPQISSAQGELEALRSPDNYNMNSFGIKLNSNGFGVHYDFSKRVTYKLRRFFEVEYNFLKDPKEVKYSVYDPINKAERRFIYGKMNSTHNVKGGYGYNRMIFEKRDKNSISIHLQGAVGASLGICKPIYYEVADSISDNVIYTTSNQKFDINGNQFFLGKAPFKNGLKEITIHPGIYVNFGLVFDFSRDVMKTNILEVGTAFDFYFRKIEIVSMNSKTNFFTLYVMYKFGSKYDANLNREYRKEMRKKERKG